MQPDTMDEPYYEDEPHFEDRIDAIAPSRATRWLLWGLVGFTVLIIAWAAFAQIDRTVRGTGRVIPSAQLQVVSTLAGGVIEDIYVKNGAMVERGQPLLKLDPTESSAEFGSGEATTDALRIKIARLQAEVAGRTPTYPTPADAAAATQLTIERQLHASRMADLSSLTQAGQARVAQTQRSVAEARAEYGAAVAAREAAQEERDIVKPLVDGGIEPRLSLVQADARLAAAQGRVQAVSAAISRSQAGVVEAQAGLARIRQDWRSTAADELATAQAELAARESSMPALQRRVDLTVVRAPLSGRINRLLVNTQGSAVTSGQPLVELVPTGGGQLIEARIGAQDIGRVRVGQEARIAITAYDQSIHGTLAGTVDTISPDSLLDERTGEIYYQVRIRTEATSLASPTGQVLPIGPGMVTEVSLVGERRSVLSYLLTPITRLRERAFRE